MYLITGKYDDGTDYFESITTLMGVSEVLANVASTVDIVSKSIQVKYEEDSV